MKHELLPGLRITLLLTLLTGLAYPAVVTPLCQWLFPAQANGGLITKDGHAAGSTLIGQTFTRPEYFHPRPSAVSYDAANSGGSNLGPTSAKLHDRVQAAVAQFRRENPDFHGPIPADLLTTSGSGLDPDLSPAAARAQAPRIARARGLSADQVNAWITDAVQGRTLGFLGEPRVNVLALNLMLDRLHPLKP